MIEFNKNIWTVYDPDNILKYQKNGFNLEIVKSGGLIHPREDLMHFNHNHSNISIELGYYGNEIDLKGIYSIHILNLTDKDPWCLPIEKYDTYTFLEAIAIIQTQIYKYT